MFFIKLRSITCLLGYLIFTSCYINAQCPSVGSRNNGNDNRNCGSNTGMPSGWNKTGSFLFTSGSTTMTILKVYYQGSLNQDNTSASAHSSAFWFGAYNGTTKEVCFYNISASGGVPPAGNWQFDFDVPGGLSCSYSVNNSNVVTLPLIWETVSAQKQNGQVFLNWSTASEQNTKDFEVQYSTNATSWDVLGTVQAAGNSSATRNYSFTHQTPLKNSAYNYYRILQRDLDGKFSYSKIVSIIFNEPGLDFLVYPNPADKVVTIYLSDASEVSLINSAGSVVWRSKLPAGRNQISVSQYSKGVYILTAGLQSYRVLIQ